MPKEKVWATKSEYARMRGWSPQYVDKLRRRGRLVLNAHGRVDVTATDERLNRTMGHSASPRAPLPIAAAGVRDVLIARTRAIAEDLATLQTEIAARLDALATYAPPQQAASVAGIAKPGDADRAHDAANEADGGAVDRPDVAPNPSQKPTEATMPNEVSRFEQDPALRTSTGQVIRVPRPFNVAEFALPGNHREFKSGVVAVYDGSSETGAVWIPTAGRWLIRQPVARSEFMAAIDEGERAQAAVDASLH